MVTIADLLRFTENYPPGHTSNPYYAFSGGTAMQCWLHGTNLDRDHYDIDVFAFVPNPLAQTSAVNLASESMFAGGLNMLRLLVDATSPLTELIQFQVTRGFYFDAEIIPALNDLRSVTIDGISLNIVSPEFLAVALLSFPNVHRPYYFHDVMAMNRAGLLNEREYLANLLRQTSLGKLIKAQDILELNTIKDLQNLIDHLHFQLIKRFVYCEAVSVEALNPFQFFVLLDLEDELCHLDESIHAALSTILKRVNLNGRKLQVAKFALLLLALAIPSQSLQMLWYPEFHILIHHWFNVFQADSDLWLLRAKNYLMTLRQVMRLEKISGKPFSFFWTPTSLMKIASYVLVQDPLRLRMLARISCLCHDLQNGRISVNECSSRLQSLL